MKTKVYTIGLKPGAVNEYKRYHQNVWPEVIEALNAAGIRINQIYLLGDRLVNIIEIDDDLDADAVMKDYYKGRPKVAEWDRLMKTFQEPVKEAGEEDWWVEMEQIFNYNGIESGGKKNERS